MGTVKNPKGAGRRKNFTTQELLNIVDRYVLEDYSGIISASKIAKYAKEKLEYTSIAYYHFTNVEIINKRLEELKSNSKKRFADESILAFQNININMFVDKLISNPLNLKKRLLDLQYGQESMYKRTIKLESDNRALKAQLKDTNFEDAMSKIKELKNQNKEHKETIKLLSRLVDVDSHIKMCKYVWENSLIEPNDIADQYITTLLRCGVINEIDVESIKQGSDSFDIEEDEDDYRENVVEFATILEKADKEIQNEDKIEDDNASVDDLKSLLKD